MMATTSLGVARKPFNRDREPQRQAFSAGSIRVMANHRGSDYHRFTDGVHGEIADNRRRLINTDFRNLSRSQARRGQCAV